MAQRKLKQRTDRILEKMNETELSDNKLRKRIEKVKEESLPKLEQYDKQLDPWNLPTATS